MHFRGYLLLRRFYLLLQQVPRGIASFESNTKFRNVKEAIVVFNVIPCKIHFVFFKGAEAWVNKIVGGTSISPQDNSALREFAGDLKSCKETLKAMDYTAEINTQTTLLKIVERLPYCLNSRWIRRARKIREKGGNVPTIENLTEFVDDDPVYSRLNKLHETREHRKTGSAKVTKPWSKGNFSIAADRKGKQLCVLCSGDHLLFGCDVFKAKRPEERLKIARDFKLCFNCLQPGHNSSSCRLNRTCTVSGCGRKHTKFLHQIKANSDNVVIGVAAFLLHLQENFKTPQIACGFVANKFADIIKLYREMLEKDVFEALRGSGINDDVLLEPALTQAFQESSFEKAFNFFSNQRNIENFVAEQGRFVEPVEYILGRNENTGKEHTMQYVPILRTLKALLKSDDVLGEIYESHKCHDKLADFCDSTNFKSNTLFSNDHTSLQIQLYYDEFTVANLLGTHVQMLKFSACYFVLGNLSPVYRSKLHHIQLAVLCPSLYVKKYGLHSIFTPLLEDLKILEQEGIQTEVHGEQRTFYGTVSFLSADNLGSHEIGGFQTHFNHGRICRECNVTKNDLKNHFRSDTVTLTTVNVYDQQAQAVAENPGLSSVYGIKKASILNQLSYFHVENGLPPDLAHDLLEVVPAVLCEVV
ncbi:hypothetical protein HOLleu_43866 [Holothuria leucospilota]|uniref:CCHC-type domain-containing protein n=1 Tax=Holothuria leucospilota TaxID=206669 RepID=A0A9Q1B9J6_HOLLE|nr:hypothetical protein HOLleu_43866 [Holothuria leucospilota]